MTRTVPVGEVRPFGDRAFLVGAAGPAAARAFAGLLKWALPGTLEAVCGYATVMVRVVATGAAADADPDLVEAALRNRAGEAGDALAGPAAEPTAGRLVEVPCAFDGPDLAEVAGLAGISPDAVVQQLTAATLEVAVVGFAPGFAYLDGLPEPLQRVPRRDRPRPVVPAGSVALANGHAAVYPTASPGGWQLIGCTGLSLFSTEGPPYAVLAPGDRVRFRRRDDGDSLDDGDAERLAPRTPETPAWSPPAGARRVLELLTPGLRAVLQDVGRRGVAGVGVPAAGPADPSSFALALGLVSGAPRDAALELTGGGARLRTLGDCHVAVAGALPGLEVDGRSAPDSQVLPLRAGQELDVGRLRGGCRTYLAVAGGFLGPEVFGSRCSDELTRLGAGPLGRGTVLWAGAWAPPLGDHLATGSATALAPEGRPVRLRVVPGPHAELFVPDALARLTGTGFEVTTQSNRVGIRLRPAVGPRFEAGPRGLLRPDATAAELDSHGVVTGAIQVPPSGEPVVLLPDHATLGGYPVLAVVITADHGLLGQCAPGTRVRLEPVALADARETDRSAQRTRARAVLGHYPLAVE